MRVLIINPPYLPGYSRAQRSPAVTRSGTIYYPVWLASCCGVLKDEGFEILFVDCPAEKMTHEDALITAKKFRPTLIVMDTSTPSIDNDLSMAGRFKEVLPEAYILLVGTHVSVLAEQVLRDCPNVDGIARHEYDYTVRDVACFLRDESSPAFAEGLSSIPGLSFRKADKIIHNSSRPFIKDLDSLPWVSRVYAEFLDVRNYFNPNSAYPMVTLTASRGCPFKCSFCLYPQTMMGHEFRLRSINDLLDEVEYVFKALPSVRSIFFEDDTLAAIPARCHELCKAIRDRGLIFSWSANVRADLDYHTLKVMKDAGCRLVCAGFESSEKLTLDAVGKGIDPSNSVTFVNNARKAGLLVHSCWIFGLPEDSRESVMRTIEFAIALDTDTAQFYPAIPYPGTKLFKMYDDNGWIMTYDYSNWLDSDGQHACVVRNDNLSPQEIDELCALARKRFYLRFEYIASRVLKSLTDPVEFKRTWLAGKTFLKHLLMKDRSHG